MSKKIVIALVLAAGFAAPAFANGSGLPLLGALVQVGNHGSIANVAASVDQQSRGSSSLADVKLNVLNGAVKANVAVDQSDRHATSLLNIGATVLDGGVGNRGGYW